MQKKTYLNLIYKYVKHYKQFDINIYKTKKIEKG